MNIESIIGDYNNFLEKVFASLGGAGFSEEEFKDLDHLAYRIETNKKYSEKKVEFDKFGKLISENEVNGRPIAVYQLNASIKIKQYSIDWMELIAPSDHKFFKEGLEHAEFIIKKSFKKFKADHGDVKFIDKPDHINPCLVIQFDDFAVKFIVKPLIEIIKLQ